MKKKSLVYTLLVISGLTIILLQSIRHSPFGRDNTSFSVDPGTDITGIDLIQGENKVTLRGEGDDWRVNKTMEARKSAVLFITGTLREIKIKSPVSAEKFKEDIADKGIEPVRINVYSKRRIVRSFYVYKTGSNIYGNIMKVRPSSKPYIVYLPGYEDNIGSHFVVNELFWQPFTVFRLLPSQIESVEFQNYEEPEDSFIIKKIENTFTLCDKNGPVTGYDSIRVKRYISYFISVAFESWAFDLNREQQGKIESSKPQYRITVRQGDGSTINLTTWEKWDLKNGEKVRDTDRVWAETENGNGLFIMRYFDLDPILKKKSYFFGG